MFAFAGLMSIDFWDVFNFIFFTNWLCLAGLPAIADNVETQPLDINTIPSPPEPETVVSPPQSAPDRRAKYRRTSKGKDETAEETETHPAKTNTGPGKKPKEPDSDHFTASDEED